MLSLYEASVPMMIKSLRNLKTILNKAEEHCKTQGTDPKEMLTYRLVEDMRP